jgi:hypothetical protein
MIASAEWLLIGAVAAVGVLHTVVPDHWAPRSRSLRASKAASPFPRLEADSLGGRHVVLPDDAGGKPIVLVLGFARESEEALNTWAHKLLAAAERGRRSTW